MTVSSVSRLRGWMMCFGLALALVLGPAGCGDKDDELECGDGTEEDDGECVVEEDDQDTGSEADADTDADSDTDTDTDTDTDADSDTDTDTDTDADSDTDADADADITDYINTTVTPSGSLSCFDGTNWLDASADAACQASAELEAEVLDFESDNAVADATVSLWSDDQVSSTADSSAVSDHDGRFALTTSTCSAQAFLVATDPSLGETVDTYSHHVVFEPTATQAEVGSVATTTYQIIPSLLGISPSAADGLVVGTALDCDGERFEGAQVVVRDASTGALAEGHVVKYFVDDFPNRNQAETSADGLWVAIDVPPGDWVAELYTSDGAGGHDLMSSTPVQVRAESFHIIETQVGHQTGVVMPAACLDC
jgi:hypothetical protein